MSEEQQEVSRIGYQQPFIRERSNGLFVSRDGSNNYERLSNFHCRITKEVIIEGIKTSSIFTIWIGIPIPSAEHPEDNFTYSEEKTLEVDQKEFRSCKWIDKLGSNYAIFPMQGGTGYVNIAASNISRLWQPKEIVKVCQVLGFKEENEKLIYVSGNDIIGDTSGIEAVPLQGSYKLAKYGLKQSNPNITFEQSLYNSLDFLDLADSRITVPLWCSVWRAPLCYWKAFPGMVTLVGRTGSFKSSIAAKALSHFGTFRDNTDLPLKWIDTAAAQTIKLTSLRDVLVVIDDFNPEYGKHIRDSMGSALSLLLGDAGDGISKSRANADMTLKDQITIRNLIVNTAEIIPNLPESRLARMMVIELNNIRTVYKDKLFAYDPTPNTFIMREYVDWLRANPPDLNSLSEIIDRHKQHAHGAANIVYERTSDLYGQLMLGVEMFDTFLRTKGYHIEQETMAKIIDNMLENCLSQNPIENNVNEANRDYCELFYEGIRNLINENEACILGASIRQATIGNDRKPMIGYQDEEFIYLSFLKAIAMVNNHRHHIGLPEIPVRVLGSDLRSKYGANISKLHRINKQVVMRGLKVESKRIFLDDSIV